MKNTKEFLKPVCFSFLIKIYLFIKLIYAKKVKSTIPKKKDRILVKNIFGTGINQLREFV